MDFKDLMTKLRKKAGDSLEVKKEHSYSRLPSERIVYCPKCGSKMIKRRSKPGLKSQFWYGCSDYPGCRSIVLDINLKNKHYEHPN